MGPNDKIYNEAREAQRIERIARLAYHYALDLQFGVGEVGVVEDYNADTMAAYKTWRESSAAAYKAWLILWGRTIPEDLK